MTEALEELKDLINSYIVMFQLSDKDIKVYTKPHKYTFYHNSIVLMRIMKYDLVQIRFLLVFENKSEVDNFIKIADKIKKSMKCSYLYHDPNWNRDGMHELEIELEIGEAKETQEYFEGLVGICM